MSKFNLCIWCSKHWKQLTPRAHGSLVLAQHKAGQENAPVILPLHLLAAFMDQKASVAYMCLTRAGYRPGAGPSCHLHLRPGQDAVREVSDELAAVLAQISEWIDETPSMRIGPERLLLALARLDEAGQWGLLSKLGPADQLVTPEDLRFGRVCG